jgi:2-amino-4-hydroxy-6-hydroxymethyldihydropteridine diphosphokinase
VELVAVIYLSLGSNIDRHARIASALDALEDTFGALSLSSVYESDSVGFSGDNFFNLVVRITSDKTVGEVSTILKKIEDDNGRDRTAPRFGPRSLDIDILTIDEVTGNYDGIDLPRDEILKNAFVLLPLAELASDTLHPVTGKTYSQHWEEYDKSTQKLWTIEFVWQKNR